jgi:hypothetical protein
MEQLDINDLQMVIDYLREYVKRGDPSNPISDIIGRMLTYACMMKLQLTGESEE